MSNICNCPNPPGGQVICENNQLALCIIENGVAIQRCMNPPQNRFYTIYSSINLINWTLEAITQQYRNWDQKIYKKDIEILKSGIFEEGSLRVNFKLSQRIITSIYEFENDSENNLNLSQE